MTYGRSERVGQGIKTKLEDKYSEFYFLSSKTAYTDKQHTGWP